MSSIHVDFGLFSKAPLYELAYDARHVLSLFKVKKFQNTSKAIKVKNESVHGNNPVPVTKQNESKINLLSPITNHLYNLLDKDELVFQVYFDNSLSQATMCPQGLNKALAVLSEQTRHSSIYKTKQCTIKYSIGTKPFQYLRVWVEAIARLPIGTIPTVFCRKGVNNWGAPSPDIWKSLRRNPTFSTTSYVCRRIRKFDKTNQPIKEGRNVQDCTQ